MSVRGRVTGVHGVDPTLVGEAGVAIARAYAVDQRSVVVASFGGALPVGLRSRESLYPIPTPLPRIRSVVPTERPCATRLTQQWNADEVVACAVGAEATGCVAAASDLRVLVLEDVEGANEALGAILRGVLTDAALDEVELGEMVAFADRREKPAYLSSTTTAIRSQLLALRLRLLVRGHLAPFERWANRVCEAFGVPRLRVHAFGEDGDVGALVRDLEAEDVPRLRSMRQRTPTRHSTLPGPTANRMRVEPRNALSRPCEVKLGESTLGAWLLDRSQRGARLRCTESLPVGAEVEIDVDGDRFAGRVVNRHGTTYGLQL